MTWRRPETRDARRLDRLRRSPCAGRLARSPLDLISRRRRGLAHESLRGRCRAGRVIPALLRPRRAIAQDAWTLKRRPPRKRRCGCAVRLRHLTGRGAGQPHRDHRVIGPHALPLTGSQRAAAIGTQHRLLGIEGNRSARGGHPRDHRAIDQVAGRDGDGMTDAWTQHARPAGRDGGDSARETHGRQSRPWRIHSMRRHGLRGGEHGTRHEGHRSRNCAVAVSAWPEVSRIYVVNGCGTDPRRIRDVDVAHIGAAGGIAR